MPRPSSIPARLGLLFMLYFVQGLPFGFQSMALPVYLREAGLSRTAITLAGAVSIPWLIKLVWAPLVERYYWPHFGRRRSWIVPMQVALAAACAAAAFTEPDSALVPLLALTVLMNLFTATMDVAVDGLAVDTLQRRHLGYGNIAQVVGYKVGIITSGGFLLAASDALTWTGVFAIMTALVGLAALVMVGLSEPARPGPAGADTARPSPAGADMEDNDPPPTLGAILGLLTAAVLAPAGRWLLLFIATYKMGETMADALFRLFLVDEGFDKQQIGLWVGTYGMIASIAGSICGGILASRMPILRALAIAAAVRVIPIFGEWWLTWSTPSPDAVIAVTVAENFFGGALTTAMFAFMMSQVDRRIGATHFTALATVEVIGKMLSGLVAGIIADAHGYSFTFGLATGLSAAYLVLFIPLFRVTRINRETGVGTPGLSDRADQAGRATGPPDRE